MKPSAGTRKFMIIVASMVCVFYLVYRAAFTFNLATPYATFASVFLYVGELFGIINLLLYFVQVWEVKEPPAQPVLEGRTVDVFVPTYNEDPQLLRATLEACVRMDYPHKTFVLDDGRRPEVEKLANELGVHYITRPDNRHAKAGNLNNAFEQTSGEFVIILDADHVPEPHFITRLIGYFGDERCGFVQTPHAFYNFDSFQAQLNHKSRKYWEEGDLFYRVIQPGRNHWNAPIFAGSAAMFRRSALREIGYIAVETITEDLHTGLRMHARGWRGLAITERLIAGQAAPDITTFHAQRLRWGEGNLSIMFYDFPPTMKGLTLPQRLCYFGSMIHWASGVFKLFIYLTPILMLFTGVPPVREFTWALIGVTVFYLVTSLLALKVVSNGYGSIINSELFGMVNFWTQIKATFRALFRRRFQRFVVTPKRITGERTVWPYIRPQTYLIIASILALFWGWSRLALGISDDKYKPLVPTIWVLIHISLAYLVTRRAFWPADKRFSTRHVVHLPVEYEVGGRTDTTRFGVTVDLNDAGMALIAYEQLPLEQELRVTLRGAGEVLKLKGEIRSVNELIRGRVIDGYRFGVQFKNMTTPQIDAINRICMQYAVPRMYAEYDKGNRNTRFSRFVNWKDRGMAQRRGSNRYPYHLPMILNPGASEETAFYTATEDVSRDATAAYIDYDLPPNTLVGFNIPTPMGEVRGMGRVIRTQPQPFGGRVYYRCIVEFQDFEGQGRTTLHSLVNPAESAHLAPLLKPDRKPTVPKMAIPLLIISLIAIPLILAQMGVFRFVHKDDFTLRSLINKDSKLTEQEQDAELNRIFADTKKDSYPTTDRMVLLLGALSKRGEEKNDDTAMLLRRLAGRDNANIDLAGGSIDALLTMNKYDDAEDQYKRLQERSLKGDFRNRPDLERQFNLAAARVAVKRGDFAVSADRFRPIVEASPDDAKLRNEYAGVLISAGRPRDAANLLSGSKPIDFDGRKLLIAAYTIDKQWDKAEDEVRKLKDLQPNDPLPDRLLADVNSARGYYTQSREILEKLLKQSPDDANLKLKLAQIDLYSKKWDDALERYQEIIEAGEQKQEVIEGWVDAASSLAKDLTPAQKKMAVKIYDDNKGTSANRPVFLARLGWVLSKINENEKSKAILEQAANLPTKDASVRDQLAGVYIKSGEWERAIEILGGTANPAARKLAVGMHIRKGELDKAEIEARALLDTNRDDLETEKLVADIHSWKKEHDKAIAMYEKMRKDHPTDRAIQARLAEISLWKGSDFPGALARYTKLLEDDFDFQFDRKQPSDRTWDGFIDAASGAATLDPAQARVALKIAAAKEKQSTANPLMLSRLAWVLLRSVDSPEAREEAGKLLDKAVAMKPTDSAVKTELAGVLARAEKYEDAVKMLEGASGDDDRLRIAFFHAGYKNFEKAEEQIDALLAKYPNDKKYQRLKADVISWKGDFAKSLQAFDELAKLYPEDPELPVRQAEILLWAKDYDAALAKFTALMNQYPENPQIWGGFSAAAANAKELSPDAARLGKRILDRAMVADVKDPLLQARLAMLAMKLDDVAKTEIFVNRAVQSKPADTQVRKELASLLLGLKRPKEAVKMFEGLTLDRDDRKRYVNAAAAAEDLATAARQARLLVQENPNDKSARRLLADVLSWKGDFQESLTLYERLLRDAKEDRTLKIDAANVYLWASAYPEAMKRYGNLLGDQFEQALLWEGFIDAASSIPPNIPLNEEQKKIANAIYDRWSRMEITDPARLSRLGWVMFKIGETAKASKTMDRALALRPKEPSVRKELAGVLAALGRTEQALALIQDLPNLNLAERGTLASLLTANRKLDEAEAELRKLVLAKPGDVDLKRQLADVLLWNGKYRESEDLFASLLTEKNAPEIQLKLAQSALWDGNSNLAAERFADLLKRDGVNAEYAAGYVDALSGLKKITPDQEREIRRINERMELLKSNLPDVQIRLLGNMGRIMARLSMQNANANNEKARSKQLFMQAIAMDPKSRTLWQKYAQTLFEMKDYAEADQILGTIINGELPTLPARRTGN